MIYIQFLDKNKEVLFRKPDAEVLKQFTTLKMYVPSVPKTSRLDMEGLFPLNCFANFNVYSKNLKSIFPKISVCRIINIPMEVYFNHKEILKLNDDMNGMVTKNGDILPNDRLATYNDPYLIQRYYSLLEEVGFFPPESISFHAEKGIWSYTFPLEISYPELILYGSFFRYPYENIELSWNILQSVDDTAGIYHDLSKYERILIGQYLQYNPKKLNKSFDFDHTFIPKIAYKGHASLCVPFKGVFKIWNSLSDFFKKISISSATKTLDEAICYELGMSASQIRIHYLPTITKNLFNDTITLDDFKNYLRG